MRCWSGDAKMLLKLPIRTRMLPHATFAAPCRQRYTTVSRPYGAAPCLAPVRAAIAVGAGGPPGGAREGLAQKCRLKFLYVAASGKNEKIGINKSGTGIMESCFLCRCMTPAIVFLRRQMQHGKSCIRLQ